MATPLTARPEDVDDDATDLAPEVYVKDVVLISTPEASDDDATDVVVAGGPVEVVAAEDLGLPHLPPPDAPRAPDDIEDLLDREELVHLRALVLRLQGELEAAVGGLAEARERAGLEARRGDTWQELALRSEAQMRQLSLDLERFRGFACSPWWVRLRGMDLSA